MSSILYNRRCSYCDFKGTVISNYPPMFSNTDTDSEAVICHQCSKDAVEIFETFYKTIINETSPQENPVRTSATNN